MATHLRQRQQHGSSPTDPPASSSSRLTPSEKTALNLDDSAKQLGPPSPLLNMFHRLPPALIPPHAIPLPHRLLLLTTKHPLVPPLLLCFALPGRKEGVALDRGVREGRSSARGGWGGGVRRAGGRGGGELLGVPGAALDAGELERGGTGAFGVDGVLKLCVGVGVDERQIWAVQNGSPTPFEKEREKRRKRTEVDAPPSSSPSSPFPPWPPSPSPPSQPSPAPHSASAQLTQRHQTPSDPTRRPGGGDRSARGRGRGRRTTYSKLLPSLFVLEAHLGHQRVDFFNRLFLLRASTRASVSVSSNAWQAMKESCENGKA